MPRADVVLQTRRLSHRFLAVNTLALDDRQYETPSTLRGDRLQVFSGASGQSVLILSLTVLKNKGCKPIQPVSAG